MVTVLTPSPINPTNNNKLKINISHAPNPVLCAQQSTSDIWIIMNLKNYPLIDVDLTFSFEKIENFELLNWYVELNVVFKIWCSAFLKKYMGWGEVE